MLQKIIFIFVLFRFDRIYGLKRCQDCVFISSCEKVKSLENDLDPDITETFFNALCDFQAVNDIIRPKIYCSDFTDIPDGPKSINGDNITNHNNLVLLPDDCGPVDTSRGVRDVGGTKANLYEYPWMALLPFREKGTGKVFFKCAGTIINSRYILTAAQCFDSTSDQLIGVRVGEYEIGSRIDCQGNVCEFHIQDLRIIKVIPHENYNKVTKENDIALIRTWTPIDFGHRNVKPICLPVSKELRNMHLSGTTVEVAGWGRSIDMSLEPSKILLKVYIPVWEEADCVNSQGSSDSEPLKILCAGEKGKDSCKGDSGGPLMSVHQSLDMHRMVQFGVVSKGSCGSDAPGIYTDLTKYIYWILENIEN